ncbi:MAG: hypothetical protein ACM3PE_06780 [Deltaproteobacteria bacterium]
MISIIRRIVRLYLIQIFASIAVALAIYFPGLDLVLSLIFCLVIAGEALIYRNDSWQRNLFTVVIWQLPGLILSLMSIMPADMWGEANYGFFVLQFWYTPLVPLLSCLSGYILLGKPVYYYLLLWMPVILGLYYSVAMAVGRRSSTIRV